MVLIIAEIKWENLNDVAQFLPDGSNLTSEALERNIRVFVKWWGESGRGVLLTPATLSNITNSSTPPVGNDNLVHISSATEYFTRMHEIGPCSAIYPIRVDCMPFSSYLTDMGALPLSVVFKNTVIGQTYLGMRDTFPIKAYLKSTTIFI